MPGSRRKKNRKKDKVGAELGNPAPILNTQPIQVLACQSAAPNEEDLLPPEFRKIGRPDIDVPQARINLQTDYSRDLYRLALMIARRREGNLLLIEADMKRADRALRAGIGNQFELKGQLATILQILSTTLVGVTIPSLLALPGASYFSPPIALCLLIAGFFGALFARSLLKGEL